MRDMAVPAVSIDRALGRVQAGLLSFEYETARAYGLRRGHADRDASRAR